MSEDFFTYQDFAAKEYALQSIQFVGKIALSRLIINVDEKRYEKGEVICKQGQAADHLFIIMDGLVKMDRQNSAETFSKGDFFGEEAPLNMRAYLSTMIAETDCIVLTVHHKEFWSIIDEGDIENTRNNFYINLMIKINSHTVTAFRPQISPPPLTASQFRQQLTGWLLCALAPIVTFSLLSLTTMPFQARAFLAMISALSLISVFKLMPDYLAMFAAVFAFMASGIVPARMILSGFSSNSFVLALSLFGLSTVLLRSGILYRIMLIIISSLPKKLAYSNLSLFFFGIMLSLGVPNLFIRSDITKDFFLDIVRTANVQPNSKTLSSLIFSAFSGASLFTQCFYSASMTHFIILGMFWGQYASEFDWVGWFYAALVATIVLLVGFLTILFTMFKDHAPFILDKNILNSQRKLLGPVSTKEVFAITSLVVSTLGILTTQHHGIEPAIILLLILIIILLFNFLTTKVFQQRIRWDLLIFLASLAGLIMAGSNVGLAEWLGSEAKWLVDMMRDNIIMFLAALMGAIIVLRFFFTKDIVINFLCIIFVPLAQKNGVNPWIIAFTIFTASRMWFAPIQDVDLIFYLEEVKAKIAFRMADIIKAQMVMNLFYILSIIGSVFYWRYLGILPW